MKINEKVQKLQQGGIALPTFTYNPLSQANNVIPEEAVSQAASSKSSDSGDSSQKEIVKNLLEQIKTKGLPSDVENFFGSFSGIFPSFFGGSSNSLSPNMSGGDVNGLVNNYVSLLPKLNRISFNKENWDESMKNVVSNEALDEYAINANGMMIVYNEDGELKQLRQKEYLENAEEYQPITNAELANLRANNPNLAWDTSVFSSLNSGIGTSKITEQILSIMSKVGREKTTTDKIGSKTSNILKGIQQLVNEGPENVFYQSTETNDSQTKNAQEALKYIFSTLPNNAKAVLRTRAAVMGVDPDKGVYEIIANLMSGVTSSEQSIKIDMQKDPNFDYESGSSNKNRPKDYTQIEQFVNMEGVERPYLLSPGKAYAYSTSSIQLPQLLNTDGKAVGQTDLMDAFTSSPLGGQLDLNSVYAGDKHINVSDLNKVFYMGNGVSAAWLPYTIDENGRQKVDTNLLDEFSAAQNEIKNKYPNGNAPAIAIQNAYSKVPGITYNANTGQIDYDRSRFAKFAMMEIAASNEDDVLVDPDDSLLLSRSKSDNLKNLMVNKLSTKDSPFKVDDVYTGIAFIPMIGNSRTAQNASKNNPTVTRPGTGDYYSTKAVEQNNLKLGSFKSANKQTNNLNY